MSNWYIIYNGQQVGPMTKDAIMAYHPTGDTKVWKPGMPDWQPIYSVPELMALLNGNPHVSNVSRNPGAQPPSVPPQSYSTKDKTVAGILAILLGGLGIQYFYLGKVGAGLITILLSLVTCGIWPLLMLVQGILMLTMTEQEFDRKFVYTDKFLPLF